MVHVIVIGDQKFYHDADRTRAGASHYMLDAVGDISNTIADLARRFAPGHLGEAVGQEHAMPVGGNIYRATVGVRREPKHAKFVHGGTGVHGPEGRPYTIRKPQTHEAPQWGTDRAGRMNPAVGNVLKIPAMNGRGFMIGGKPYYFRREVTVLGQKPQPFLTEAFDLAKRTEVPLRVRHLARQFAR